MMRGMIRWRDDEKGEVRGWADTTSCGIVVELRGKTRLSIWRRTDRHSTAEPDLRDCTCIITHIQKPRYLLTTEGGL